MKKFLCVLFVILTLTTCIMITVSAEDAVVKSILPSNDDDFIYTIYPSTRYYIDPIYYHIRGKQTASTVGPGTIAYNPVPFIRTYHPNVKNEDGIFEYELFDGQSKFVFSIQQGNTVTVTLVTANLNTGNIQTYSMIPSTATLDYDWYMYVGIDGYIYLQRYNVSTNYNVGEPIKLAVPLYGDIYIYNRIPESSSTYEEGYLAGMNAGLSQGYNNGYQEGKNDQSEIFNNSIGNIVNNAYADGYDEGYIKGQADSSSNSTDSQYWYNVGYIDGQNTNGIVEEGINGFWEGMKGFATPFLDIGIGNLRVYSVLALVLIGALALLFIKLTRG